MKQQLENLLRAALEKLQQQDELTIPPSLAIHLERPKTQEHGDFSTNIALSLAKQIKSQPLMLAEKIVANIPASTIVEKITIAKPGFINFSLQKDVWHEIVKEILGKKHQFGCSSIGSEKRINIEFVSSNPTGPLHVGHGRSAAYGASVANLLSAIGFDVHREYYVNDGGRQMDILTTSIWLRYLELLGETLVFPSNGYRGDYILPLAQQLKDIFADDFYQPAKAVFENIPADEPLGGDKEIHIDALNERAKLLLGIKKYETIFEFGLKNILTGIREDLADFNVNFDEWFSERSLMKSGAVEKVVEKLRTAGYLYEREGALWFNSTAFGDDKDRVILRENGQPTYFAVDAAYRANLFNRGYDSLINVLGADHHGYVPRIRAVIQAQNYDVSRLTVPIVQFATLYRGKERVPMSTRSGSFVTLRELCQEVGTDAARFFYVLRKCEQHMDFDLELAKSQTTDNPVYYIQYAHARICSVLRQAQEKNLSLDESLGLSALKQLQEVQELNLLRELSRYSETVELAALNYEPHLLAYYLRDLATAFHAYYNTHVFLVDEKELRNARLLLITATRYVLANGLKLLGVSAPETM